MTGQPDMQQWRSSYHGNRGRGGAVQSGARGKFRGSFQGRLQKCQSMEGPHFPKPLMETAFPESSADDINVTKMKMAMHGRGRGRVRRRGRGRGRGGKRQEGEMQENSHEGQWDGEDDENAEANDLIDLTETVDQAPPLLDLNFTETGENFEEADCTPFPAYQSPADEFIGAFDPLSQDLSMTTVSTTNENISLMDSDIFFDLSQDSGPSSLGDESLSKPTSMPLNLESLEKQVFDCIIKEFSGSAPYSELICKPDLFPESIPDKAEWLKKHHSSFLISRDEKEDIDKVTAFSSKAKICFNHLRLDGCEKKVCPFFHVCKRYISGSCSFGATCSRNHSFSDEHNQAVLVKMKLQGCTDNQLLTLVKSSQPTVCLPYNKHRCSKGDQCTKIHICKSFIQRKCKNPHCNLGHEASMKSSHTREVLRRYMKVPPGSEIMKVISRILVCDDDDDDNWKPTDDDIKKIQIHSDNLDAEICANYLLDTCKAGTGCYGHHCPLPYQWIYKLGDDWQMFGEDDNDVLETLYSYPCNDEMKVTMELVLPGHNPPGNTGYLVDFESMTMNPYYRAVFIKRLSTGSSVYFTHSPDRLPLATKWVWYWEEDTRIFKEYKQDKDGKDPSSDTLERHFLDGDSWCKFEVGDFTYRLYMKEQPMIQKNLDHHLHTKREVRRRPLKTTVDDLKYIKHNPKAKKSKPDTRYYPPFWRRMPEAQEFCRVQLPEGCKEYKDAERHFNKTMKTIPGNVHIVRIERVQNPVLWDDHVRRKRLMNKKDPTAKNIEERRLFHGTPARNIRSICKENFDWRLYGNETGNIYGEGAYFARDASMSNYYCTDDEDGLRYMFLANVLVGSYTKGEKNHRRPPRKDENDPHSELYDSCVDNVSDPKVFVAFDFTQYYPSYLIEYTVDNGSKNTSGAAASTKKRPTSSYTSSTVSSSAATGSNLNHPLRRSSTPPSAVYTGSAYSSPPVQHSTPSNTPTSSGYGSATTQQAYNGYYTQRTTTPSSYAGFTPPPKKDSNCSVM